MNSSSLIDMGHKRLLPRYNTLSHLICDVLRRGHRQEVLQASVERVLEGRTFVGLPMYRAREKQNFECLSRGRSSKECTLFLPDVSCVLHHLVFILSSPFSCAHHLRVQTEPNRTTSRTISNEEATVAAFLRTAKMRRAA